ncbi:hypothetical protein TNCV_20381 [Trichonephila clavipes]|nr:hypothetical protein TNCV_20381 [Trichonephila clavipes]
MDGFSMVIWNAVLDLNSPLSPAAERVGMLPGGLNGLCSPVKSPESRTRVFCKTTSVCTNSLTTFATAWTLS